jgi:small GTP-binding protein
MMDNNEPIKVILLGESGVGKTNLINVSLGRCFNEESLSTQSCYYSESSFTYKDKTYFYNLWDTAGQEQYRSLNRIFLQKGKIILLVYSIDNETSFKEIEFWLNYVKENLEDEKHIIALIANKSDLYEVQKVSDDLGREFAEKNEMKFSISSAKTNSAQFKKFLIELLQEYIDLYGENLKNNNSFGIKNVKKKKKHKC